MDNFIGIHSFKVPNRWHPVHDWISSLPLGEVQGRSDGRTRWERYGITWCYSPDPCVFLLEDVISAIYGNRYLAL